MRYDEEKVDEMTLALLYLVMSGKQEGHGAIAWKGFDWSTLIRLHQKGWIGEPKVKSISLEVTEEGFRKARELFLQHFGVEER